jgi:hypothetical protein
MEIKNSRVEVTEATGDGITRARDPIHFGSL